MRFRKHVARLSDLLGLPRDVLLTMPRIQMLGDQQIAIENHSGILEYSTESVRLQTKSGRLAVRGTNLRIFFIGPKDVQIFGSVISLTFETA